MKNGRLRQDDKGNPTDFEDVEVKKGCLNPEFLKKQGLNATSEPVDWVEAFWPRKNDPGNSVLQIVPRTANSRPI